MRRQYVCPYAHLPAHIPPLSPAQPSIHLITKSFGCASVVDQMPGPLRYPQELFLLLHLNTMVPQVVHLSPGDSCRVWPNGRQERPLGPR